VPLLCSLKLLLQTLCCRAYISLSICEHTLKWLYTSLDISIHYVTDVWYIFISSLFSQPQYNYPPPFLGTSEGQNTYICRPRVKHSGPYMKLEWNAKHSHILALFWLYFTSHSFKVFSTYLCRGTCFSVMLGIKPQYNEFCAWA
jgi:hypothetical protein